MVLCQQITSVICGGGPFMMAWVTEILRSRGVRKRGAPSVLVRPVVARGVEQQFSDCGGSECGVFGADVVLEQLRHV